MLTGTIPLHPATFTDALLVEPTFCAAVAARMAELELEVVFDPFGGRGRKLGGWCDLHGYAFDAVDIEQYPDPDPRVRQHDSTLCTAYPSVPFLVITSPAYLNGISSDYREGPTPNTKTAGRHSYGISLGRALAPNNLARTVVRSRPDKGAADYYAAHAGAVRWWGAAALVNVTSSMIDDWCELLERHYDTVKVVAIVETPRVRGGLANAADRDPFEVWIEAVR